MTSGARAFPVLYDPFQNRTYFGDGDDTPYFLNPHESDELRTNALVTAVQPDGDVTTTLGVGGDEILAWDDLRFPAQGINPPGAIADPAVDTTETGFPGTLLFSGSADNMIAISAQMPHAWKPGTAIVPHIHWSKPVGSSSAVTWELYYRWLGNVGDTADANWTGPIAGTLEAGTASVTNDHLLTSFGSIATPGTRESTMYTFRIYRRGSTDADNGTARLYEFDIHYQKQKAGTFLEYPEID